jgi:hypothetical protein
MTLTPLESLYSTNQSTHDPQWSIHKVSNHKEFQEAYQIRKIVFVQEQVHFLNLT